MAASQINAESIIEFIKRLKAYHSRRGLPHPGYRHVGYRRDLLECKQKIAAAIVGDDVSSHRNDEKPRIEYWLSQFSNAREMKERQYREEKLEAFWQLNNAIIEHEQEMIRCGISIDAQNGGPFPELVR